MAVNSWDWEQQLRDALEASGENNLQISLRTSELDRGGVSPGQLSRFRRGERSLTLRAAGLVASVIGGKLTFGKRGR
jgi:hypothetical protein